MPISEETKIEIANRKSALETRRRKLKGDNEGLKAALEANKNEIQRISTVIAALEADIPTPTPAPEEE